MSRSRRKNPYLKDGGKSSKTSKQAANRIFRSKIKNLDYLPQKGSYKKFYQQYDINDWITSYSLEEVIKKYYAGDAFWFSSEFDTVEDLIKWWKITYYYK